MGGEDVHYGIGQTRHSGLVASAVGGSEMDFVIWLITGLVAGLLAMFAVFRTIPRERYGVIGALVIGVVGGWLGGWVSDLIGLDAVSWIGSLVVAFAGAFIILRLLDRAGLTRSNRAEK